MPRVKRTAPKEPTRETGQRSLDLPNYLLRIVPEMRRPAWLDANNWRAFVRKQPVAVIVRDLIISHILSLEWSVEPRDTQMRDEYKKEINGFTDFIQHDGNQDYTDRTERLLEDFLDTPFGGAMETIRSGDSKNGKVVDLLPLDAATLFPTLNKDFPVGQRIDGYDIDVVYFPAHAINRIGYGPRPEIQKEGWYCAPPERIYLAVAALSIGDSYYLNFLLDTPPAGILDLMDMEKTSAVEWIQSFRAFMSGNEALKIPVLYEHQRKAEWIPFGKDPSQILYDSTMLKYVTLVTAGYGTSPSDIGISPRSSGGETLAGSIRQERGTRKTGIARTKLKLKYWYDRILPPYLEYKFVDLDDELSVALGRARLSNAQAWSVLIDKRMFLPEEGRQQFIADGLVSISVPETLPEDAFDNIFPETQSAPFGQKQPKDILGNPVPPSSGGQGEIRKAIAEEYVNKFPDIYTSIVDSVFAMIPMSLAEKSEIDQYRSIQDDVILGSAELLDDTLLDHRSAALAVMDSIVDKMSFMDDEISPEVAVDILNFISFCNEKAFFAIRDALLTKEFIYKANNSLDIQELLRDNLLMKDSIANFLQSLQTYYTEMES